MYAIKAEVSDVRAASFAFREQKTMYGGKKIAGGDTIFVFASEKGGGVTSCFLTFVRGGRAVTAASRPALG